MTTFNKKKKKIVKLHSFHDELLFEEEQSDVSITNLMSRLMGLWLFCKW